MTERRPDRLTDIVTRTGDDGSTGLADGRRVAKHDPRIEALGAVDELNSGLGLLLTEALPADIAGLLVEIQNDLFDLGGELALPDHPQVSEGHVARLDAAIAEHNAQLPPLKEFVLPGGCRAAAQAHVCRSVCRRAERRLASLAEHELLSTRLLQYLNRLSDLLFVLARVLNLHTGAAETTWRGPRKA
jgi:cob(I)alamin adenosyltransferase